jgi:hypothetical protein
VTVVVGAWSEQAIWLAGDRRLSYGGRRRPRNDATKLVALEAEEGRTGEAADGTCHRDMRPSR